MTIDTGRKFDVFHPHSQDWASQVDWNLRYEIDGDAAGSVMEKLAELGFTIIPPPMPRYAVTYSGHVEFRTDDRAEAERWIAQLSDCHVGHIGTTSRTRKLSNGR
jgi:hypothetical protein